MTTRFNLVDRRLARRKSALARLRVTKLPEGKDEAKWGARKAAEIKTLEERVRQ